MLVSGDELRHHGIKGQRWGVRRFQEEDGSLTPAGKERYADDLDSNKKQIQNEKQDVKKNTIFTKRNIAIGATAAVAALAVIGYMRYKKNSNAVRSKPMEIIAGKKIDVEKLSDVDNVIKKGTKFQRISSRSFEDYAESGKTIYASFDKKDNRIYAEDMVKNIQSWRSSGIIQDNDTNVYKHTMTMNKDVKVASPKKVAEAYKKATGNTEIEQHKYMKFMTGLSDRNNETNNNFFNELRKMGYNAIVDENDAGHYTKSPLILLNPGSDVSSSSVKVIKKLGRILNVILM